jgi:NACHT domain
LRFPISSTVIQEAKERRDAGLALMGYFYFDFKDTAKQDVRGLLASLLAQFSAKSDHCYHILFELYSTHDAGSQQPSNATLAECLKKILNLPGLPPVYIIVDALDECPNTSGFPTAREKVLELLEDLVTLKLPNLRICVTSRPEVDIQSVLEPLSPLSFSLHDKIGHKNDICHYVRTVVHSDRRMRRWRVEDKQLVIDTLSTKANGM